MTDRPILFSAPMVRAILDGHKTQTRRIIKDPDKVPGTRFIAAGFKPDYSLADAQPNPYGSRGDRLWVREGHYLTDNGHEECVVYLADVEAVGAHIDSIRRQQELGRSADWAKPHLRMRPSIHMPRWASRITLEIVQVRIERLKSIPRADAIAEGLKLTSNALEEFWEWPEPFHENTWLSPVAAYAHLWDKINGTGSWDANPWVWVVEFKRVQP